MSYGSDVQGHNLTPVAKPGGGDCYLVESYEQSGAPAFGYPAKDQRELAAECRRL
jgi:hypothetical protein